MGERVELENGDAYKARYERKEELGRGKFGVVFQVKDVNSASMLAAKHIRTRSQEQKDRVKEECGIMRRLANPNVIKFVDAFENSREIILGKVFCYSARLVDEETVF